MTQESLRLEDCPYPCVKLSTLNLYGDDTFQLIRKVMMAEYVTFLDNNVNEGLLQW